MGNLWYVELRLGVRLISGPVFQPVCLRGAWLGRTEWLVSQIRGSGEKNFGGGK